MKKKEYNIGENTSSSLPVHTIYIYMYVLVKTLDTCL